MSDIKRLNMPPLSERLAAAVSFVSKGNRTVDVGCDHGYTAIGLRNAGISPFCICTDINKGPLTAASANIRRFETDGIETRLCDGLSGVLPGEAETVVITGMGGELICRILEAGKNVVFSAEELVLGPQSEPEKVRLKIYELGFHIADEAFVCEDGKYYPVIKAIRWAASEPLCEIAVSGEPGAPCETELKYGPALLSRKDPVLKQYLEKEQKQISRSLESLRAGGSDISETRMREAKLVHLRDLNAQAQEYYK